MHSGDIDLNHDDGFYRGYSSYDGMSVGSVHDDITVEQPLLHVHQDANTRSWGANDLSQGKVSNAEEPGNGGKASLRRFSSHFRNSNGDTMQLDSAIALLASINDDWGKDREQGVYDHDELIVVVEEDEPVVIVEDGEVVAIVGDDAIIEGIDEDVVVIFDDTDDEHDADEIDGGPLLMMIDDTDTVIAVVEEDLEEDAEDGVIVVGDDEDGMFASVMGDEQNNDGMPSTEAVVATRQTGSADIPRRQLVGSLSAPSGYLPDQENLEAKWEAPSEDLCRNAVSGYKHKINVLKTQNRVAVLMMTAAPLAVLVCLTFHSQTHMSGTPFDCLNSRGGLLSSSIVCILNGCHL